MQEQKIHHGGATDGLHEAPFAYNTRKAEVSQLNVEVVQRVREHDILRLKAHNYHLIIFSLFERRRNSADKLP